MKKLLFLLFVACAVTCAAQKTADSSQYFVVLYTLGESWDTTKAYHEQKHFDAHSTFLSSLRKNKTIVLGARYSETGMIVIRAQSETEAKALVNKDVAVQNKLFRTEVYLFDPFYGGCINVNP